LAGLFGSSSMRRRAKFIRRRNWAGKWSAAPIHRLDLERSRHLLPDTSGRIGKEVGLEVRRKIRSTRMIARARLCRGRQLRCLRRRLRAYLNVNRFCQIRRSSHRSPAAVRCRRHPSDFPTGPSRGQSRSSRRRSAPYRRRCQRCRHCRGHGPVRHRSPRLLRQLQWCPNRLASPKFRRRKPNRRQPSRLPTRFRTEPKVLLGEKAKAPRTIRGAPRYRSMTG